MQKVESRQPAQVAQRQNRIPLSKNQSAAQKLSPGVIEAARFLSASTSDGEAKNLHEHYT